MICMTVCVVSVATSTTLVARVIIACQADARYGPTA